jgi:hypothetical protein
LNCRPLGPESSVTREAHHLTPTNPNKILVSGLPVLVRIVPFPDQFTERKTESRLCGRPPPIPDKRGIVLAKAGGGSIEKTRGGKRSWLDSAHALEQSQELISE